MREPSPLPDISERIAIASFYQASGELLRSLVRV